MIVKRQDYSFLRLLFGMKGSIVPAIAPHIICSAILGALVCLVVKSNYLHPSTVEHLQISFGPFTALGVAISLFLGFHNNASYNRWWEARSLWGKQIIVTRVIARFLLATLEEEDDTPSKQHFKLESLSSNEDEWNGVKQLDEEKGPQCEEWNYVSLNGSTTNGANRETIDGWRQNIVRLSCAHTHAFRYQMRPLCEMDGANSAIKDRNRFLTQKEQKHLSNSRNPANSILFMAAKILGKAHRANLIDTYSMIHVQTSLDALCEVQTACERIHNTSLPLAYSLLVHRTSFLFVLLVPFAIVEQAGWWTPVFNAIVAYTFFGLDRLAKEIQEPFGDRPMCLALSAMSRTIEIDALEALGKDSPPFLTPKSSILM